MSEAFTTDLEIRGLLDRDIFKQEPYATWLKEIEQARSEYVADPGVFRLLSMNPKELGRADLESLRQLLRLIWVDNRFGLVGTSGVSESKVTGSEIEDYIDRTQKLIKGLKDDDYDVLHQVDLMDKRGQLRAVKTRALAILSDLKFPKLFKVSTFKKVAAYLELEDIRFPSSAHDMMKRLEPICEDYQLNTEQRYILPDVIYRELIDLSPNNYWWINFFTKSWFENPFEEGQVYFYDTHDGNGQPHQKAEYFKEVKRGDLLIAYSHVDSVLCGLFRVTRGLLGQTKSQDRIEFEFLKPLLAIPIEDLERDSNLSNSEAIQDSLSGNLYQLTNEEYNAIAKLALPESTPADEETFFAGELGYSDPDNHEAPDQLGIQKDVEAFARLIVFHKANPPLAIGLLGNWGVGKSFFMEKIEQHCRFLSKTEPALYHKDVVHIRFNTWHYVDANLWASLVYRIFDGLNLYVDDNYKIGDLKFYSKQLMNTESEINRVKEKQKNLGISLSKSQKELKEVENKIKELDSNLGSPEDRTKLILNKIWSDGLKDRVAKELSEYGIKLDHVSTFVQELSTLKEKKERFQTFLRKIIKDGWFWGIVVCMPLFYTLFEESASVIGAQIATFLKRLTLPSGFILGMQHIYKVFSTVRQDYEQKVDLLKAEFEKTKEAEEKRLSENKQLALNEREALIQKKNELIEERKKLENQKKDFKSEIHEIKSGKKLAKFLKQLVEDEDYQDQLGLIAKIHEDFRVLDQKLRDQKDSDPDAIKIDRIVLYIDDLDRCPEERVVEVLEAVRLILSFPLFVAVVGVDPRWVSRALYKKYHGMLVEDFHFSKAKLEEHEVLANEHQASRATTLDFLEKIFQIPFRLLPIDQEQAKKMVSALLLTDDRPVKKLDIIAEKVHNPSTATPETETHNKTNALPAEQPDLQELEDEEEEELTDHERLLVQPWEIEIIQKLAGLIGDTPRTIQRFSNIYRLIRAHQGLQLCSFKENDPGLISIMLLLAFIVGEPELAKRIYGSLDGNESFKFSSLLENLPEKIRNLDKKDLSDFTDLDATLLRANKDLIRRFSFTEV